jgi:hypothetical protein
MIRSIIATITSSFIDLETIDATRDMTGGQMLPCRRGNRDHDAVHHVFGIHCVFS